MDENKYNTLGQPLFFQEGVKEYQSFSVTDLRTLLKENNSGYIKSRVIVELAHRKELQVVFAELVKLENQKLNALFSMSVAQISGLCIIGVTTFDGTNFHRQ